MADNEPKKRRSGAKNSRKRKGTQRGLTLLNQKKPDDQVSKKSSARSFPASTFEEALVLAQGIQQFAAGQRVRRLTLFDNFGKSPDSGPSRQLVTNSSKYGLTKGSYGAEYLELTEDGRTATSQDVPARDRLRARFKLAIESVAPFKALCDHLKGGKLPAKAVLHDFLADKGYRRDQVAECVDTFVLNAKFLGILKPVAGAERLLPIEHILEETAMSPTETVATQQPGLLSKAPPGAPAAVEIADWSKICFYVTPIGEPESEERKHADLFLSSIVEPALDQFDLRVVRADQIGKPGMITAQVIEHVVKSRLVVADLSFHNPNVFYELSLRHACRLPTVQLIRACDRIPFDLDQFRTIQVDTASIYTLVPQLETYRSEIASQVRRALTDPDAVDNPLSVFYPGLEVRVSSNGT